MEKKSLGHGGFGQVWLLPDTDPPMVVKKAFAKTNEKQYLRELETLKELSHENIVSYYDQPTDYTENDKNEWLIFMEYCEHGSLKDVLKNKDITYTMATVAQWSKEMFSGLEYLKSKKMVHQDIKPDNLFIHGPDYTLKLGDFGCVRRLETRGSWRGGTLGYMAPETKSLAKLDGEDAYKCDIYAAGWAVVDMASRRNHETEDLTSILKDIPDVHTLKRLMLGCTQKDYGKRFGVEEALQLCKEMTKESIELEAKPDPDRSRNSLEPPTGLGISCLLAFDALDISDSDDASPCSANPSERLLIELKEKLETPTAFDGRVFRDEKWLCKDGLETKGCEGSDHESCKKNRRELCDRILTMLSELPTEDQYKCAEEMDIFWKVEAPKLLGREKQLPLPKIRNKKLPGPIANILDAYMMLVKRDVWHQSESHSFGVWVLCEVDRGALAQWDILTLLNEAVYDIEELGKLFTVRASYGIESIKGSRHSWFIIKGAGAYLRKDCSETRVWGAEFRDGWEFDHVEPLNNEQIRRALIEAGKHLERKLRSLDGESEWTPKIDSFPGQPFPGYNFVNGIPPSHQCNEGKCGIVEGGGFPKTVEPEFRVKVYQCATTDQIDYIEEYTLITRALQYIFQWQVRTPIWWQELAKALLTEIELKPRQSKFLFALLEIEDCSNALLFQYDRWLPTSMVITKNLELLDYSNRKVKCLRFVGLTLADITPMLGAIRDYYKKYDFFSRDEGAVDPEVMQPLINAFWNEIMTTKSEEWEALTSGVVCETSSESGSRYDRHFDSKSE